MISKKNNKAITFIELLIAIAITASLISVTWTFYLFAFKWGTKGQTDIHIHSKLRNVLEDIELNIRNAKEIVEVSKSRLEMKIFRDPKYFENHIVLGSDELVKKVVYELEKGGPDREDILYKIIDDKKYVRMKFDDIGEEIFVAYTYDMAGNFIKFDSVINDSWQRERISLVTIHLNLKENQSALKLTGSVCPRYLFGKKKQPYWNFTTNSE
jgi:hypothetical protein